MNAVRLADHGLAESCEEGFEAIEAGRGRIAAHLLVPQLERAVRLVAQPVGVMPMRRARHGGLRWASLDEMLQESAVQNGIACLVSRDRRYIKRI